MVSVFSDYLQDFMNETMVKAPEVEREDEPSDPGSDRDRPRVAEQPVTGATPKVWEVTPTAERGQKGK